MKPITIILGPTAIGKTQFAIEKAYELNAEIISADAFQVYRDMDIGTAKPSKEDLEKVPHHLINIKSPDEGYSVVEFLNKSNAIIESLKQKGTPIIICGGTAFYLMAFLYNYTFDETPESTPQIREKLEKRIQTEGREVLLQELKEQDPDMYTIIDTQNDRRIIRALEIMEQTGKKASEYRKKSDTPRDDVHVIGLEADRTIVYNRINERVNTMIDAGLIDEVQTLLQRYPETAPGFEALGYKQCIDHLKGSISKEEVIQSIQTLTRRFAKRQLTWYKRFEHVEWLPIS